MESRMNKAVVEVRNLHRSFNRGTITALRNVTFDIAPGEAVSILGANGAGKTTLVKILATLLRPTAGQVRVAGHDVLSEGRAVRGAISVVFGGDRGLYDRLSAQDNLRFFGALKGQDPRVLHKEASQILAQVGLDDRVNDRIETFSRGMKQRLHLAIGLLGRPRLLILDEPTIGLDVVESRKIREAVSVVADSGTAVLLTSHNVTDIDRLASRVLFIRGGVLESDQPLSSFRRRAAAVATIEVRGRGAPPETTMLTTGLGAASVTVSDYPNGNASWRVSIAVDEWTPQFMAAIGQAMRPYDVTDFWVIPLGLETVIESVLGAVARP
jgi:ABC-2 type transport system ATP-binding protein